MYVAGVCHHVIVSLSPGFGRVLSGSVQVLAGFAQVPVTLSFGCQSQQASSSVHGGITASVTLQPTGRAAVGRIGAPHTVHRSWRAPALPLSQNHPTLPLPPPSPPPPLPSSLPPPPLHLLHPFSSIPFVSSSLLSVPPLTKTATESELSHS